MKDAQGKRTGFKAGANGFGALDERAGWFRRRCRSTLLSEQSEQKNTSRLQNDWRRPKNQDVFAAMSSHCWRSSVSQLAG